MHAEIFLLEDHNLFVSQMVLLGFVTQTSLEESRVEKEKIALQITFRPGPAPAASNCQLFCAWYLTGQTQLTEKLTI
jgi:hypothetical protein